MITVNKKILFILSFLFCDLLVLLLSFYAAFYLRFFILANFFIYQPVDENFILQYATAAKFMIPLWLLLIAYSGSYTSFFIASIDEFVRTAKISTLFILSCIVLSFLIKIDYSRTFFVFLWINITVFMFFFRQILKYLTVLVLRMLNKRNTVLMIGKHVKKYKDIFKNNPINKVFYYPLILTKKDVEKIKNLLIKKKIRQIIIVDHDMSDADILSFYDWAEYNEIIFKMLPSEVQMCRGEIVVDSTLSIPVLRFISTSLNGTDYFLKRSFDIIVSVFMILILFPFFVILSVLIKIESKGSVFYTQIRQGYRGKKFNFYKFRSMVTNADDILKDIKETDAVFFKMKKDPRITKIGSFIRKYSLDELPQLFNVLKGDMSLVGPRPMLVSEVKELSIRGYNFKKSLRVLPGITGLWQVSGRSLLSDEKRIELDIFYVEHWSFGLDLKILFKTIWIVLFPKGAY